MVWYEDIVSDRLGVMRELATFTGFELPQPKMEELADMLRYVGRCDQEERFVDPNTR